MPALAFGCASGRLRQNSERESPECGSLRVQKRLEFRVYAAFLSYGAVPKKEPPAAKPP